MSRSGLSPAAAGVVAPASSMIATKNNQKITKNNKLYFDPKKGELYDLQQSLRQARTEKDGMRRRDVLKRVISYMTVGIDVSCLFSEMVMTGNTSSLVEKKMVYLYLTTYAESNPDLSILSVNTFRMDASHEDPHVRGIALRSMCSLKLSNLIEYLDVHIRMGLRDVSGYVRAIAVIGCLKLHSTDPPLLKRCDIIQTLHSLLRDSDTKVICNVISVFNEIYAEEGGWTLTKDIVHYFLTRLNQFDQWGQCMVLNFISSYKPSNEDELYRIFDVLDDLLKSSCAAVTMSCTKCFVSMSYNNRELLQSVIQRLKTPLITLISVSEAEAAYIVLLHLSLLIEKGGEKAALIFENEYKYFYAKFNDPTYMKIIKIRLLSIIASIKNAEEIHQEVVEYIKDINPKISKCAIEALRTIAVRIPSTVETITNKLLVFLSLDIEYIAAMILCTLKDLLRKYPEISQEVAASLNKQDLNRINEPMGLAALTWILGEFGEYIEDAPLILEEFSDRDEEDEHVQLELLTAAMKLFFKYPSSMQCILGRILKKRVDDTSNPDVHDRALLYYRMLNEDINMCKEMFSLIDKRTIEDFDHQSKEKDMETMLSEFDTLSVVYDEPSDRFVRHQSIATSGKMPSPSTTSEEDVLHQKSNAVTSQSSNTSNLLEFDTDSSSSMMTAFDIWGNAESKGEMSDRATTLIMKTPRDITSEEFKIKWHSIQICEKIFFTVAKHRPPPFDDPLKLNTIEERLQIHKCYVVASGLLQRNDKNIFKLFIYNEDTQRNEYYTKILVDTSSSILLLNLKWIGSIDVSSFKQYFKEMMHPLITSPRLNFPPTS